jgi:NAD(P)-dependent dehydrogenase (short-subunit alcohol dehydrogenase family)
MYAHSLLTCISGFGVVKALAARPDTIVFAGARNPSTATALHKLAEKQDNVHVVQLTACHEAQSHAATAEIKRVAGALHVVVANAGENFLEERDASLTTT